MSFFFLTLQLILPRLPCTSCWLLVVLMCGECRLHPFQHAIIFGWHWVQLFAISPDYIPSITLRHPGEGRPITIIISSSVRRVLCCPNIPISFSTAMPGRRLSCVSPFRILLSVPSCLFCDRHVMVLPVSRAVLIGLISEFQVYWFRIRVASVTAWRRWVIWRSCVIQDSVSSQDTWLG